MQIDVFDKTLNDHSSLTTKVSISESPNTDYSVSDFFSLREIRSSGKMMSNLRLASSSNPKESFSLFSMA
jgi:hypothetical protein